MQIPMVLIVVSALLIGGVAHTSANDTNQARQSDVAAFSLLHENRSNDSTVKTATPNEISILGSRSSQSYLTSNTATAKTNQVIDYRLPSIDTISIRNIEANSAEFRGEVNMRTYTKGTAFLVYGYNINQVNSLTTKYKNFASIPKLETDAVRTYKLDANAKGLKSYNRRISGLVQDTDYFYKLCIEYINLANKAVIKCGEIETFTTNLKDARSNNFRTARVSLDAATFVNAYDATLSGTVTMNDAVDGIAFFVYGEDQDYIKSVATNFGKYSEVKEDGEDLQRVRVGAGLRGKGKYSEKIEDLDNGTQYFYSMCVEFDGNKTGLVCSGVKTFTTDNRDLDDAPQVITGSRTVLGSEAKIYGSVAMRDYFDGLAFFVYGTDEVKIKALGGKTSFNRIGQSIDKLQRVSVDNDMDGKANFALSVRDLKDNSIYFYRMCVEYEAEDDKNREQLYVVCGETKQFVTSF